VRHRTLPLFNRCVPTPPRQPRRRWTVTATGRVSRAPPSLRLRLPTTTRINDVTLHRAAACRTCRGSLPAMTSEKFDRCAGPAARLRAESTGRRRTTSAASRCRGGPKRSDRHAVETGRRRRSVAAAPWRSGNITKSAQSRPRPTPLAALQQQLRPSPCVDANFCSCSRITRATDDWDWIASSRQAAAHVLPASGSSLKSAAATRARLHPAIIAFPLPSFRHPVQCDLRNSVAVPSRSCRCPGVPPRAAAACSLRGLWARPRLLLQWIAST